MRLLFAGTPAVAVPSLQAVRRSRHELLAVLTRPDAPTGRGARITPSPVASAARQAGIQLLQPVSIRGAEFEAQLRALRVDAVAVVAFGALIPRRLLHIPAQGWINLHFSLLPSWRGAAPVQAAVRAGDEITGASTFRIEEGLDTGPVYGTVTEPIRPTDTAGDLLERLSHIGARLLVATLDGIADGTVRPLAQPPGGVSHAPKVTAEAARVDVTAPALAVDRMIRSMTPAPGAWVESRWGRLRLGPVTVVRDVVAGSDAASTGSSGVVVADREAPASLAPGEILAGKRDVLLGTGSGAVRLGTVQAPGKRPVPAADWARGARPRAEDRLGLPAAAQRNSAAGYRTAARTEGAEGVAGDSIPLRGGAAEPRARRRATTAQPRTPVDPAVAEPES